MSNQNRQLYIVISQTGTLLSRILKQITGAEYNHASISLSRDLERITLLAAGIPIIRFGAAS